MKAAIVYFSKHHQNTFKVVKAISDKYGADLIDVSAEPKCDLRDYDVIGFASGIYYSKFHKQVISCAENCLPKNKKVFLVYTYSAFRKGYTNAIMNVLKEKNAAYLGEYNCPGFNTFGLFKLLGGIKKGRPNNSDISGAIKFFGGIAEKSS